MGPRDRAVSAIEPSDNEPCKAQIPRSFGSIDECAEHGIAELEGFLTTAGAKKWAVCMKGADGTPRWLTVGLLWSLEPRNAGRFKRYSDARIAADASREAMHAKLAAQGRMPHESVVFPYVEIHPNAK